MAQFPADGGVLGGPMQGGPGGPAVLQNNIILNINGNTSINNYHHHGQDLIQGRKLQTHNVRMGMGQKDSSSEIIEPSAYGGKGANQPPPNPRKPAGKTLIPKKLLNQAKSSRLQKAGQKPGRKENVKSSLNSTQNMAQYQTGRMREKKKAISQFELNFNTAGTAKTGVAATNVTLDYEKTANRPNFQEGKGLKSAKLSQ